MILFSPLINIAIREMNRKQHQLVVWLIAIILCVMPTVFVWERDLITKGMDYTWFLALYIIAAYIRKYGIPKWMTMKVCIWTYVICSLITGGVRIPLGILSNHLGFGYTLSGLFFRYNSMLVAGASIALFCFFLQLRIREGRLNRLILQVAPLTFAIYLIHEHPLIRELLWDFLPMHQWFTMGIPSTLVAMCVTVLIIFLEKITQITCRYQFLNNQITISYHPVLNSGRFPNINNSLSMSLKIGVSLLQSDDSS